MSKESINVDSVIDGLGGTKATADLTGLSLQAIANWRARKQIPTVHCQTVSAHSGIPLHELRPDIFPAPQSHE